VVGNDFSSIEKVWLLCAHIFRTGASGVGIVLESEEILVCGELQNAGLRLLVAAHV
jgi:hypothetical protein